MFHWCTVRVSVLIGQRAGGVNLGIATVYVHLELKLDDKGTCYSTGET